MQAQNPAARSRGAPACLWLSGSSPSNRCPWGRLPGPTCLQQQAPRQGLCGDPLADRPAPQGEITVEAGGQTGAPPPCSCKPSVGHPAAGQNGEGRTGMRHVLAWEPGGGAGAQVGTLGRPGQEEKSAGAGKGVWRCGEAAEAPRGRQEPCTQHLILRPSSAGTAPHQPPFP